MSIKQTFSKVGHVLKKHSPMILTTAGVVGLGATAYLAYKSRDAVGEVVVGIEEDRELEREIDKVKVVKDLTEALYLPITVGVASVSCILLSYRIQNNRIAVLTTTLAAQQAHSLYMESKYKKVHGEEAYEKFMAPTDEMEFEEVGKNGKTKMTVKEVKKEVDKTIGQWYDESEEYASDDHSYNVAYIDSVKERMQLILFQRGTLTLNEVREALGFDRIRAGALLGWSGADAFDIDKVVMSVADDITGEMRNEIWVTWTKPKYIYDTVEFSGRYSIYEQ